MSDNNADILTAACAALERFRNDERLLEFTTATSPASGACLAIQA